MEQKGPEAEELQDIFQKLDSFEKSMFEARSAKLLAGLGFSDQMMNKMTKDLSGGWRMRVALAQVNLFLSLLVFSSLLFACGFLFDF
jgi:ATP-binding cassette subfamily F protein 2